MNYDNDNLYYFVALSGTAYYNITICCTTNIQYTCTYYNMWTITSTYILYDTYIMSI